MALRVALTIGKCHFAIATTHAAVAIVDVGVACEILRSDNVSDNRGSDNRGCTVFHMSVCLSVSQSVSQSVCLSVSQSVSRSVCLSDSLSVSQ